MSSLLAERETDDREWGDGDCIACRELLLRIDADLAEYERELALRKPTLGMQLAAGIAMAGAALAILLWFA